MRSPHNDRALTPDISTDGTAAEPRSRTGTIASAKRSVDDEAAAAERRCILTGVHGSRDALIRLAISPEGQVVPDIMARAPGRGAWIAVDRTTLETALAKGKLKGALARAYKGAALIIPPELPAMIDDALRRSFLSQLGLAAKAGVLLTGAEKVDVAARSGQVALLAHASDAAEDGRRKRDQSWRVGEDEEGTGKAGLILPVDRSVLSVALGRDNAVHIAIIDSAWGNRLSALLDRWQRFAGWARGGAAPLAITRDDQPPVPVADGDTAAV